MKISRILVLYGGGMKGLFSAHFMKQFCIDAGINPNEIWKHFDVIVAASIGSIMGIAYALGKTPEELISFFEIYGPQIFRYATFPIQSPMSRTNKGLLLGFVPGTYGRDMSLGGSFYGDGSDGELYNSILETQLKNVLGETTKMFQLKTKVMATGVRKTPNESIETAAFSYNPIVMTNIIDPDYEGANYLAWEVAMASGAAPFYLPPVKITGATKGKDTSVIIDGGLCANNPVLQALSSERIIESDSDRIVILSVSCGLDNIGFFDPTTAAEDKVKLAITNNVDYMTQMIGVAGTGAQEINAQIIKALASYNVRYNNADLYQYNFTTFFDPNKNTELDNSGDDFNNYMKEAMTAQYEIDQWKISSFIRNAKFNT